ncbi:DUF63 family protein [Candidatus Micrarchaeota archaeon]|nr:DUF63 family protein [Candidatus Micrarchaeota archaeon]
MADFFQTYFIDPIIHQADNAPYNVYNTTAYAVIALVAVYLIYRGLKKAGFSFNQAFFEAIIPYVIFGGIFRVLEDAHAVPRIVNIGGIELYPFVTPLVYVFIFLVLSVTSVVAWFATKNRDKTLAYVKKAGFLYAALSLLVLVPLFKNWMFAIGMLALAGVAWGAYRPWVQKRGLPQNRMLSWMVFGQVLDGSATFIGLTFAGYSEQHVVGNFLIDTGGPALFWLVKVAFAIAAAEALRKEPNENARNFVALLITIFGLAPGLRDLIRILAGV